MCSELSKANNIIKLQKQVIEHLENLVSSSAAIVQKSAIQSPTSS